MNKTINLLTIITSLFLISCESNNIIKTRADLTFKSISFMSAYGASEEEYEKLNRQIDSLVLNKNSLTEEQKLFIYFKKLRNLKLLNKPYIFIRLDQDSILPVYLSYTEYDKVKSFRHVELFDENKKVELELDLIKKSDNIYYSENITSIKKVDGTSHSNGN
ncbi:hypothetical protein [Tenacibaculum xiamenense]|uniref:hypothetical protein n=1 Tax=Tenacibaculum xiamenense TaxID=1261553 RepID=UPI003893ECE4